MNKTISPSEFDTFLNELEVIDQVKTTLISSKIHDLKLEQELLIEKIETENNNDTFDLVQLAKIFLLIRHLQKCLNQLNKNNLSD